jgi:hypothetical protein
VIAAPPFELGAAHTRRTRPEPVPATGDTDATNDNGADGTTNGTRNAVVAVDAVLVPAALAALTVHV